MGYGDEEDREREGMSRCGRGRKLKRRRRRRRAEVRPHRMSALTTDEPAQDAPPAIDTQQLQQLQHAGQDIPQPLQPPQSGEAARKRPCPPSSLSVLTIPQPRRPPSDEPAPLVTPVRPGAAKFCPARYATARRRRSARIRSPPPRAASNGVSAPLVPIPTPMPRTTRPMHQPPSRPSPHRPCTPPSRVLPIFHSNITTTTTAPLPALLHPLSGRTSDHAI